jgi:hypothetical protein
MLDSTLKRFGKTTVLWLIAGLCLVASGALASETLYPFDQDTIGPAKGFSAFVGHWHIDQDGNNLVYAVDGRKWEQGLLAQGIVNKAKGLYGQRYAEFLDNLEAYKYFPLTICTAINNFTVGTISVRFKTISGRIDQAAGIAFAIKPNGDYLVVRANPLENNLVLFRLKRGHRSSVQWIRNVKTPSRTWHTLTVKLDPGRIQGLVNGKLYVDYTTKEDLSGHIGLWSKADSYVFFDDFKVREKTN